MSFDRWKTLKNRPVGKPDSHSPNGSPPKPSCFGKDYLKSPFREICEKVCVFGDAGDHSCGFDTWTATETMGLL